MCPECGCDAKFVGYRPCKITTLLGSTIYERAYYRCVSCHFGHPHEFDRDSRVVRPNEQLVILENRKPVGPQVDITTWRTTRVYRDAVRSSRSYSQHPANTDSVPCRFSVPHSAICQKQPPLARRLLWVVTPRSSRLDVCSSSADTRLVSSTIFASRRSIDDESEQRKPMPGRAGFCRHRNSLQTQNTASMKLNQHHSTQARRPSFEFSGPQDCIESIQE